MTSKTTGLLPAFFVALTCLFFGCAKGAHSYTGRKPAPRGSAAEANWTRVEAVNLQQLRRDYEIIGEIRADPLLHDMVWAKKQAARMGADAISISDNTNLMVVTKYFAIIYK